MWGRGQNGDVEWGSVSVACMADRSQQKACVNDGLRVGAAALGCRGRNGLQLLGVFCKAAAATRYSETAAGPLHGEHCHPNTILGTRAGICAHLPQHQRPAHLEVGSWACDGQAIHRPDAAAGHLGACSGCDRDSLDCCRALCGCQLVCHDGGHGDSRAVGSIERGTRRAGGLSGMVPASRHFPESSDQG